MTGPAARAADAIGRADTGHGAASPTSFGPGDEGSGWTVSPETVDPDGGLDSRFLSAQAQRLDAEGRGAFQRIYSAFVAARAALGVALLAAQVLGAIFTPFVAGGTPAQAQAAMALCLVYAAQALSVWLLPRTRHLAPGAVSLGRTRWLATIGFDLVMFTLLHLLEPSASLSRAALLVLPVLMAGVLTSRLSALATAAAVTLMLLVDAAYPAVEGDDIATSLTQAGLAGIGFFVITLLASELAGRLAREEMTARGSIELARQQAQLNRLVLEEMVDGVMVIDRRGRVRAANPAARRLLSPEGIGRAAPFHLDDDAAWRPLARTLSQAFQAPEPRDGSREMILTFANGATRGLRMRLRFTRRRSAGDPEGDDVRPGSEVFCVVFFEDQRVVESRTRQEKLAAMGRVSAGIAHEIRNPLSAIAQANALLQEDLGTPMQQRLTRMVADNVARLERIVADVLDVAPGTAPTPTTIDATSTVATIVGEWSRANGLAGMARLTVRLPDESLGVVFDPEHLRRVLINLLDNAHRHARDGDGAVEVVLDDAVRAGVVSLVVASDSPPITPDVERHLFEPFFSTRSRGSGLGLYICRELCERYGARIDFRLKPPGEARRNAFVVRMRVAPLPPGQVPLPT